jgi:acyl-CoA synthetase (AMP-forming)/AMP-acid ligase II
MFPSSSTADPLSVAAFTAPGQPFELIESVVRGARCRIFRHAPHSLAQLYPLAQAHASKVFTVMEGAHLTYAEVFAQAAALAAQLRARGVGRGTHVAIAMRNRPEWLVSFIAITALGAVPVLVNSRGVAAEQAYSLTYTRCRHLIADERCAALLASELNDVALQGVVVGEVPAGCAHWRSYASLLAGSPPQTLPVTERAPEDPALIMFTSGTTGEAKGAVLNHVGLLTALMANQLSGALLGARMAAQRSVDPATLAQHAPQPSTLLVFPLFHTSGCLSVFLTTLARGGKIVFLPRWNVRHALELVQQERVTALPAVPTMLWDVLQARELADFDTSSLMSLGTGGQGLPQNLLQAIQDRFPHALLGTGYGMTETNGMVSLTVGEEFLRHPESAGRPLATAEVCIADEEGRALPTGAAGEVCVRSAQNMLGYWERPDADAAAFRGGWLRTGDVGYLDAEGFLHIIARMTDMIISGGENIYCAEVERVLTQHPQVLEVATFGVPDVRLGEKLLAVIVAREEAALDGAQLTEFCRARLAPYKVPREWRFEAGPLERTATGKVIKAQVRERVWGGS